MSSCFGTAPCRGALCATGRRSPDAAHPGRGLRRSSGAPGRFRNGAERHRFGPGDVLFVPAGVSIDSRSSPTTWRSGSSSTARRVGRPSSDGTDARTGTSTSRRRSSSGSRSASSAGSGSALAGKKSCPIRATTWYSRSPEKASWWCAPGRADSPPTTTSAVIAVPAWCPEGSHGGSLRWGHSLPLSLLDLYPGRRASYGSLPRGGGRLRKAELGLHPVGVESWGGFFFLNLTPAEAAARGHNLLAPARSRAGTAFVAIRWPSSARCRRIGYEVDANWKVMLENYNECYHCGPVHPELCRLVPAFKQRRRLGSGLGPGSPTPGGSLDLHRERNHQPAAFDGPQRRRADPPQGRADLSQLHDQSLRRSRHRIHLWPRHPGHTTGRRATSSSIPPRWRLTGSTPRTP